MTEDEKKEKLAEFWDRVRADPRRFLHALWESQLHCFKCNADVRFDAEVCEVCGQELLEHAKH